MKVTDENLQWFPINENFWIDQALCSNTATYTFSAPNTNALTFFYDISIGGVQSFLFQIGTITNPICSDDTNAISYFV